MQQVAVQHVCATYVGFCECVSLHETGRAHECAHVRASACVRACEGRCSQRRGTTHRYFAEEDDAEDAVLQDPREHVQLVVQLARVDFVEYLHTPPLEQAGWDTEWTAPPR